jgi:hypothetical protein
MVGSPNNVAVATVAYQICILPLNLSSATQHLACLFHIPTTTKSHPMWVKIFMLTVCFLSQFKTRLLYILFTISEVTYFTNVAHYICI